MDQRNNRQAIVLQQAEYDEFYERIIDEKMKKVAGDDL